MRDDDPQRKRRIVPPAGGFTPKGIPGLLPPRVPAALRDGEDDDDEQAQEQEPDDLEENYPEDGEGEGEGYVDQDDFSGEEDPVVRAERANNALFKKGARVPTDGAQAGDDDFDGKPIRDFNVWMSVYGAVVDDYPGSYFFRVLRRYPKVGEGGKILDGGIAKIHQSFDADWLTQQLRTPEGGRYEIQFCGPRRKGQKRLEGVILRTFRPFSVAAIESRDRWGERPPGSSKDEEERKPTDKSHPEPLGYGLQAQEQMRRDEEMTGIVDKVVEAGLAAQREAQREAAEYRKAQAGIGKQSPDIVDRMLGILEKRSGEAPPPAPVLQVPADNGKDLMEEIASLHRTIADLQKGHAADVTQRLTAHHQELTSRLDEQRANYEARIKELRESLEDRARAAEQAGRDAVKQATAQHEAEVTRIKELNADRIRQLEDRLADTKSELTDTRSDLRQARSDLESARSEAMTAKSTLAAVEQTKTAEIKMAELSAKLQVQESKPRKDSDDDPLSTLVKNLGKAKELKETLATTLGGGEEDKKEDKKEGVLAGIANMVKDMSSSPDVRKLAGVVVKAGADGIAAIAKSREEAKRFAGGPSTSAVISTLPPARPNPATTPTPRPAAQPRPAQPPRVPPASTQPALAGKETPEPVADAEAIDIGQTITNLAELQALISARAEELIELIEDHSVIDTPIDEAAEDMVNSIAEAFAPLGKTRKDVLESLGDTTADKMLEELGMEPTRLSQSAKVYADKLIAHAKTLTE